MMQIANTNQFLRYASYIYPLLLGSLALLSIRPAYGNPVVSNGFVRGLDGFLVPNLPSLPSTSTTNGDVSTISIKSSTVVNEQGASASISATATSSNGITSQREVSQVVPGATSISTAVTAQTSNGLPNVTEAAINTSPTQILNVPAPVTTNVNSAPEATINASSTQTLNAPAPVVTNVNPAPTKTEVGSPINSVVNTMGTSAPVAVSTPAAVTTSPVYQPTAAPTTLLTRASIPLGSSSTFVAPFANPSVTQTNTAIVQQQDGLNEVRSGNKSGFSYRVVGMPSRVWPGLGLTQISSNSK